MSAKAKQKPLMLEIPPLAEKVDQNQYRILGVMAGAYTPLRGLQGSSHPHPTSVQFSHLTPGDTNGQCQMPVSGCKSDKVEA